MDKIYQHLAKRLGHPAYVAILQHVADLGNKPTVFHSVLALVWSADLYEDPLPNHDRAFIYNTLGKNDLIVPIPGPGNRIYLTQKALQFLEWYKKNGPE